MAHEAHLHMLAIATATALPDAAMQSARQCVSTRHALRQARADEIAMAEKEKVRLEKERETAAKKEAQAKKRGQEKEEKKRANEEKKKQQAAERAAQGKEDKEKEGPKTSKDRRRGRGHDELTEDDPSCLTTKFLEADVATVDSMKDFIRLMVYGYPVLWKARRSPIKKVIEEHGSISDKKQLANAATLAQSEWKAFQATLAEDVNADPSLKKKNKVCSSEMQELRDAFSMDRHIQAG